MDGCHSNAAWFTFCRETNFPSLSPSYCCWLSPYFYTTHLSGLFLENCSFFSARSPSASCFPVNWIIACSWALCKCWLSCSWFFLGSLNCFEFFFFESWLTTEDRFPRVSFVISWNQGCLPEAVALAKAHAQWWWRMSGFPTAWCDLPNGGPSSQN